MPKAASYANRALGIGIAGGVALAALAALVAPDLLLRAAPPCLISLLLDQVCWGCGMTRATVALLHAQFALAWQLNRLVYLVLPLLVFLYARHVLACFRQATAGRV